MRLRTIIFLGTFGMLGCTTGNKSVELFNSCLTGQQRAVYNELETLCDNFLTKNYPDKEHNDRYKLFLTDLFSETPAQWSIDTLAINGMTNKLVETFGDTYDMEEGNFLAFCDITTCFEKSSNSKWIDEFVKQKQSAGSIGPNIMGGRLLYSDLDAGTGLNKKVLVTEVIWRILHFRVRTEKHAR